VVVDRGAMVRYAHTLLLKQHQVSLAELIDSRALVEGLAELVAWLQIADSDFRSVTDGTITVPV